MRILPAWLIAVVASSALVIPALRPASWVQTILLCPATLCRMDLINALAKALCIEGRPNLGVIVEVDKHVARGAFRSWFAMRSIPIGHFLPARPRYDSARPYFDCLRFISAR